MPILNIPSLPINGDNRDAVQLRTAIHKETAPEDSLNIVNGLLDYENVDAGFIVSKDYTQRGSAIDGFSAARTVNLDWSWRVFGDWQTGSYNAAAYGDSIVDSGKARPIPGANKEFYAKWAGYALVTWTAFWGSDNGGRASDNDEHLTTVLLVANGTYQDSQLRHSGKCVEPGESYFYQRARAWSGHAIIAITEGFNSVGLHIIGESRIRLTRTWACNIQVVPFKYPGG